MRTPLKLTLHLLMATILVAILFPLSLSAINQTYTLHSTTQTTIQSHLNNRSDFSNRRASTTITQQSPQLPISANHLLVNILFPIISIIFVIAIILTIFSHKDFDD